MQNCKDVYVMLAVKIKEEKPHRN